MSSLNIKNDGSLCVKQLTKFAADRPVRRSS